MSDRAALERAAVEQAAVAHTARRLLILYTAMHDYTGPHDYFDENYVREWEQRANSKRPFRIQFFEAFAAELTTLGRSKVLDLGSGPGFLAEYLLEHCDIASYHLFDFSPHMLELSRVRLARFKERAFFHQGSFLDKEWFRELPAPFDSIVSLQAVHEARDPARLPQVYSELRSLVREGGRALIADLVKGETNKEKHILTVDEHNAALKKAGFKEIELVLEGGDLAMLRGVAV
jgi:SAM-dependent methyltransferase